MSIRGIKFIYSVGEPVLCFEPDPTKARVLYDAKILDTDVTHSKHGQRIPAYHIHFQGWNNSWDRVVAENSILENTQENRILMKQLSDATRRFSSNKSRNKHIDAILRRTFKGRSPLAESDDDQQNVSDEEDDDLEEESGDEEEANGRIDDDDEIENGVQNGEHDEDDDSQSLEGSEISGKSNKSEDRKKKLLLEFEIPEVLKEELEKDYLSINRDDMLVSLPAEHNVINILESFVKTFCVNLMCGTPGKPRYLDKEGNNIPFEKNIHLCKELVDGLRICFDYTLPLVLLYDNERQQYSKLQTTYKNKGETKTSMQSPGRPPGRGRPSKHHTAASSCNGEPSPKLPKLSPKIFKKEKIDFTQEEEITPRRLTRQSIHEVVKKDTDKVSGTESSSADDNERDIDKKSDSVTSSHKRGRKRRKSSGNKDLTELKEEEIPPEKPGPSKRRGDRPPPLLLPSAVSGQDKTQESTGSNESSDSNTAANREDVINSVLSWQLLPPEAYQTYAPSLVYGAQHLLRIFVKMPDLIMSMDMSESKVQALVSLLEHFLDYLTERRTELFTSSSYKSA